MKIVITGSSGLIGSALVRDCEKKNFEVVKLVRRAPKQENESQWDPIKGIVDLNVLEKATAIVNLAGAGVGDRRWSKKYKKLILDSRVNSTETLANAIVNLKTPPSVFVSGSAIGFYGDTADVAVDENANLGEGFLSDVVFNWEYAAQRVRSNNIRVVHPRTGLVMSKRGGLLKKILPLFKLGLGGKLGNGKQYWSYISLEDEIRALHHLIDDVRLTGGVNFTNPNPVTNAEFTKSLSSVVNRPAFLKVPSLALKIALGEFSIEALGSSRILPSKLKAAGFKFNQPDILSTLNSAITY
ncbi:MAG: TIGR01777 family oxidoreductase [Actinomycetota bacterium]|nr:TIGR01777 family oxidoreductase [Actinomycetota bacterium]